MLVAGIIMLFGFAVGSFLSLVVDRLDSDESLWVGRSHCNHCKKKLAWWELIPVLGYLFLRGKCVTCKKGIPYRYPLFEIITGLTFGVLFLANVHTGTPLIFVLELVFGSLLLLLFFYDSLHQSFPATILYASLIAVAYISTIKAFTSTMTTGVLPVLTPTFSLFRSPSPPYLSLVIGALVGVGLLGLLAFPSKGKWMGYGDVILIGILGLWLGYPLILLAIMLAFYSGALVGIYLIATKKIGKNHRIAFGPFLIVGALITRAWGPALFMFIMKLWGAN